MERNDDRMESIAEAPLTAQVTPGLLPRFQDGAVNLQGLLRQLAEPIVNEIMDAEADQMCGEGNSRNGYRKRKLLTCVGTLTSGVPKLRQGSFFPEDVLTRSQRVDGALVAAVAETCTTGTSTRKVQKIAQKLGIDRLSRGQVSAMYHLACEMPGGCCPKAARVLEGAEPDALAYPDFPKSHWKRLRTNNVRERTNREIKRRSRVVQAFSSVESLMRLVGAVMCEQDDGWSESRCFSEEKISELYEEIPKTAPLTREEEEELMLVSEQAIKVSLELADKMEAA